MSESNGTHQPTPLSAWIAAYTDKADTIEQAVEELLRHSEQLPAPLSAEDVDALLHFRSSVFGMSYHAASDAGVDDRAASRSEKYDFRARIAAAAKKLLRLAEARLGVAARSNSHGLFAPSELPSNAVQVNSQGGAYLTNLHALSPDHPLRAALDVFPGSPWIYVGSAQTRHGMMGNFIGYSLADWALTRITVSEEEAKRSKYLQDRAREAEEDARTRQRLEDEIEMRRPPEDRLNKRINQLEQEIARLRQQQPKELAS